MPLFCATLFATDRRVAATRGAPANKAQNLTEASPRHPVARIAPVLLTSANVWKSSVRSVSPPSPTTPRHPLPVLERPASAARTYLRDGVKGCGTSRKRRADVSPRRGKGLWDVPQAPRGRISATG